MSFTRAERRRLRKHVDPACPDEIVREVRAVLAASIANKRFEFRVNETLDDVFRRELAPALYAIPERAGFCLSFALPQNSPQALATGSVVFSIKRQRLN